MNCLIVGCGWLGLPLGTLLVNKGITVYGTYRNPSRATVLESVGIVPIPYDGVEVTSIPEHLRSSNVVLFAFPPSTSADYALQIHLLSQSMSSKTHCVLLSSTGVYVDVQGVVNEESPVQEDHPVRKAENAVIESGKPYTILRLAGLLGGDRHPINFLAGRHLENGQHPVNLVQRLDVLSAIQSVIINGASNTVFNVVYPSHPSREEYYTKVAKQRGLEYPIFNAQDTIGKSVDGTKIKKVLHFSYMSGLYDY
jgi:nucleoside-diphosphate-sugar epimerase